MLFRLLLIFLISSAVLAKSDWARQAISEQNDTAAHAISSLRALGPRWITI